VLVSYQPYSDNYSIITDEITNNSWAGPTRVVVPIIGAIWSQRRIVGDLDGVVIQAEGIRPDRVSIPINLVEDHSKHLIPAGSSAHARAAWPGRRARRLRSGNASDQGGTPW